MNKLIALEVKRKSGEEPFVSRGRNLPINLLSFWQWSSSDLVGNTLRGLVAEYIVTSAVGNPSGIRQEWDSYDVITTEGVKVEVKSSAYIQSWMQSKYSSIQFRIRPTYGWEAATNEYSSDKIRQSDVYVFCLLKHKDQATINPLDLEQWQFYVIATKKLNDSLGPQKSISLSRLKQLNPIEVHYEAISDAIKKSMVI
ncbi:hypothetical protein SAMN05216302_100599 [Nitrosomonas aestuarii]|uniref:Uncharacterized protein n=1 Tax=Nitrosomonas aestuarii TaxID=52441 RepID=A0A1I3Z6J7_9PROT|nr:hypothetical protein [Nitrosomonas aestuarii]SFK39196.1 hypothetical protein SAMN05216302_100599 [Nitrosomonas aestuarii]